MKKNLPRIILLLIAVLSSLLFLSSCQQEKSPPNPQPAGSPQNTKQQKTKLAVITSFYPLAEFAKQVGGDLVEVTNIVPAGAEPHDYEPTPQDIARISAADIFIFNGAGFETWIEKIKTIPTTKQNQIWREISDYVELIATGDEDGPSDPHIWLDPLNAQKQVQIIYNAIIQQDPTNTERYRKNTESYLNKLAQLNQKIMSGLQNCQSRDIVTSHSAFSYFAKRYNLRQIPISGLSPEEEPSAKKLAEISDQAKANHIQYIFYETLVSPKIAETLAREIGAQTAVLNPIEGLSEEEMKAGKNYISVMEENLQSLRTGLNCE